MSSYWRVLFANATLPSELGTRFQEPHTPMSNVTIYTRALCPFCTRAIKLLKKKGADFQQIDAGMNAQKRNDTIARAGGARTYPQIFVGDTHVGGCDELMALERAGELDPLLATAGSGQ